MKERLEKAIYYLELVAAVLLVALAVVALGGVVLAIWEGTVDYHTFFGTSHLIEIVDKILVFFIVVELFRIALAYMRKKGVVVTVLEAALVAIARKLVVFVEVETGALEKAITLTILTLAIGITWFLLAKSGLDVDDA